MPFSGNMWFWSYPWWFWLPWTCFFCVLVFKEKWFPPFVPCMKSMQHLSRAFFLVDHDSLYELILNISFFIIWNDNSNAIFINFKIYFLSIFCIFFNSVGCFFNMSEPGLDAATNARTNEVLISSAVNSVKLVILCVKQHLDNLFQGRFPLEQEFLINNLIEMISNWEKQLLACNMVSNMNKLW